MVNFNSELGVEGWILILGGALLYCVIRAALDYFGIWRWGPPYK